MFRGSAVGQASGVVVRYWTLLRYRLIGHWRERRTVTETIEGDVFVIEPGVFNPVLHLSGRAVAAMIDDSVVSAGSNVLELGTGCGLLAVRAARHASAVVAVDINADAVECARSNVDRLGWSANVRVMHSDLFAALPDGRFDVIITNPPYEIDTPVDIADTSFASADFFHRLAIEAAARIEPDGALFVALPEWVTAPITLFRQSGYNCEAHRRGQTALGPVDLWRVTPG